MKILKSYLRFFAIVLFALFIARSIIIVYDGLSDEIEKADVAIILGNKIESNGQPSERLKARLDGGLKIYKLGFVKKLIVSGAMGKEGFDEAEVMKTYLLNEGVPAENIITDNQGFTTYESAINSKAVMMRHNYQSAMVITQFFHINRSKLALRKAGIEPVYSAHVPYFEARDIFSLIREVFAYYYYAFRSY